MIYLLDTDTVSYLLKNNEVVLRNSAKTASAGWVLSAITVCELESVRGPQVSPDSWRARIDPFVQAVPVLPFGQQEARKGGEITRYLAEKGLPSGPYDILIAAQALVAGVTLVTHNTRHFEQIPALRLVDWALEA